jgi:poly(A) polymerase
MRTVPRPEHTISRKDISSAAIKVLYKLKDSGHISYLAGGGVRDLLLGQNPKDFDVVTDATPNQVKKIFRNSRLVGRRFRLAHVLFRGEFIEVSTFRSNAADDPQKTNGNDHHFKEKDGLILRDNIWGTPEQDAKRRDFTINALFYNIADFSIIDYLGGLEDLNNKIIRVIGDPDQRFTEDPVRMIRAVRFAAKLGFDIEASAAASIKNNAEKMAHAAPARLYEEVQKLFLSGHSVRVLELLQELGLFEHLFPELGSWYRESENENGSHWFTQTCAQLDRWCAAGLKIHPALFFALFFGVYHEHKAQKLIDQNMAPTEALQVATYEHLRQLCDRITIPKFESSRIAQIMMLQPRFAKNNEKNICKTMRHENFTDAFLYFKFAAKTLSRDAELVEFWNKRRKRS